MESVAGMMLGAFAIFCVFVVPLALCAWVCVKVFAGKRDPESDADESRMIQELHHGLSRMERRVETLETLLLERERKDVKHEV